MQIVIELSEKDYDDITLTGENTINLGVLLALRKAVRNGTPLPEHHGRLIDADELLKAIDTWDKFGVNDTNSLFRLDNLSLPHYVPYIHYDDMVKSVSGAETIIEADRGE